MKVGEHMIPLNFLRDIFFNKNICILGVDGAGKSSVIKELETKLNFPVEVQYMGSRDYLTSNMINIESLDAKKKNNSIFNIFSLLVEMWFRVVRHWGKGKVIIYDRYFWDRYLALEGSKRIIGKILFRYLYPKPKYLVYLYCDIGTSLGRKNDIEDIDLFKLTKEQFDNEFRRDKNILCIDTGLYNIPDVVNIILKYIDKQVK